MDDALRIAMVAPAWYPLPPKGYGGTELVVHLLHTELRRMGHDVTVFGAEGSAAGVTMLADAAWSHDLGGQAEMARQATYLARCYDAIAGQRFDVLHDHTGFEGLLLALYSEAAPVIVHTIHGELVEAMSTFYKEVHTRVRLCAISLSQAASAPSLKLAGVVHNAVELPTAPPSATHERYMIEVARITPDKGQHIAIEVAQRAGRKLILAGKVERSEEGLRYFEEQVEPFLSPTVEYYPNVAGAQKAKLISRAAAGLFPLQWAEPFGLAMVECMVAGTPVLALRSGSTPELIEEGVTGFLGEDADDLVEAASRLDEIDRVRCAAVARERFSPRRMAERYLEVYRRGSVEVERFASANGGEPAALTAQPVALMRTPSDR
ncbi:MAG TPA: glycosyltransferase family 4 protein [Candidatus Acidoferrum sp.]|nr:glycosyltransferase family 4 protein [Candidatus Acidoferrum sp.]